MDQYELWVREGDLFILLDVLTVNARLKSMLSEPAPVGTSSIWQSLTMAKSKHLTIESNIMYQHEKIIIKNIRSVLSSH